jgi:protein SCO1/2
MMTAQPIVIGALVAFVWWKPLSAIGRVRPGALLPYLAGAALMVTAATTTLVTLKSDAQATELPFPAEELRTAFPAPALELKNQLGDRVRLEDLRGRVVVLTGVYATCGHTCPLIMAQLERAFASLEPSQRSQVRAVLVTLNPEHDDQQVLRDLAARHSVSAPEYQFLTGPVPEVNRVLDQLQIARKKDPHSGVIDHANLFIVLDRQGKIAYRFTLGERQERWLSQALGILVRESSGGGGA